MEDAQVRLCSSFCNEIQLGILGSRQLVLAVLRHQESVLFENAFGMLTLGNNPLRN
jgi:hypothetical protein